MSLAPDPSDLTTVANLEGWLGLTNVQAPVPDQLQRLVTATSAGIQAYISRIIRSQSYNETRAGTGGDRLVLKNTPVTAVSSVVVDGQTIGAIGVSSGTIDEDIVVANAGIEAFLAQCK